MVFSSGLLKQQSRNTWSPGASSCKWQRRESDRSQVCPVRATHSTSLMRLELGAVMAGARFGGWR